MDTRPLSVSLVGILLYSVATVWVRERWAVSSLEMASFLCAVWVLARDAGRRNFPSIGAVPALLFGMAAWASIQHWRHWTAVPAETLDATLYWLAAGGLAWLAMVVCSDPGDRVRFLELLLWTGATVCLAGLVQLFTSPGRVFWLFPSGFDSEVIGPFVSRNQYAAMIELLLPIALVLAGKRPHRSGVYLALAAALVASVVASGSRAGVTIVVLETVLILLLQRGSSYSRRALVFMALALLFTGVVGYQHAWDRFRDRSDPFDFRREFFDSSLAMIRAQPLHGFGFGAWPAVYRQFALIDTGSEVNHSHNEWLQWGSEGGLPALALMLAIAGLSAPAAVRSRWGLGVPAVFLHGLVDYPFLRLGLAAWTFVLLGALCGYNRSRRSPTYRAQLRSSTPHWERIAGKAIAIPFMLCAAAFAARTAWADVLYREGTLQALAGASRLRPDRAEFELALAQADPEHSVTHLRSAVRLNPYLSNAQLLLAAGWEASGDLAASEATLLQLAERDRLSGPAWALANFYYRHGPSERFWRWARTAAQVSPGELRPLFRLCLGVRDDAAELLARVVSPRRTAERELLSFLLDQGRIRDADRIATKIAGDITSQDRDSLLSYVDRSISAGQFSSAAAIWDKLSFARLIPYPPSAPGNLVNGDFAQPILDHGFDWRAAPAGCAVAARTHAEGPALELFLAANRPEDCEIYHQFLILSPGIRYELRFEYRTADLPDPTGIYWSLDERCDYQFRSSADWTSAVWRWQSSPAAGRLALRYRRSPGSTRHEGAVLVGRVHLIADSGGS